MKSCITFASAPRFFGAAFVTALCLTASLLSPRNARADGNPDQPDRNPPFSAIYVLGDSLSDTGRTYSVIGVPPAPYFDGRFSNGPLWIEHVAPILRLGYQPLDNFSWAGANTGRINVFPGLPGIRDELDELLASSPRLDKKALYVVFGGANDFLRILANGEDPTAVIPEAIGNLMQIIATLHAAGADNIVVIDLPDIGLTPRARAGGPAMALGATYLSMQFNALLNHGLDTLAFPVVRVSAFRLLNAIVNDPRAYGFTDVTTPGIYNPAAADACLFWDDIHPTTRGHAWIGTAVLGALNDAGMLKQLLKHPVSGENAP